MGQVEKQVTYQTTNSYTTSNTLTTETKNVWMVFHGIGYLSRYFINYFKDLPAEENYIIAPQAPSKYYLNNQYRHVGASWLTKENTRLETENVLAYIDQVYTQENIQDNLNFIVFGYSQGVSIAARWVAKRRIKCNHLVLYAGGLPRELVPGDFDFLVANRTKITVLVGDKDEYMNAERLKHESGKTESLFQGRAKQIIFEGGHEVKKELLNQFL
ncbi:alpha/beta hydrolase [Maribacter arenosus]|uniref:Esterase n=1 Tax=Maribacter arenosus TaxID=1854708 RepID=A0ABR7V852_9FLAO|nr:esterase [Maribacter arenosus]MBD0849787.1 esterase [Maribacter arenosus]